MHPFQATTYTAEYPGGEVRITKSSSGKWLVMDSPDNRNSERRFPGKFFNTPGECFDYARNFISF